MSTAAVIGAPPAPVGRRILAVVIDGVGTSLCALPIWIALLTADLGASDPGGLAVPTLSVVPTVIGAVLLAAWGVTQWVLLGSRGWTVGRRLLGLRVVDARTGRPIGLGRALVRALIVSLGSLACGIGQWVVLASVFWDPTGRRRGWHDRVSEAVVVDIRSLPAVARLNQWSVPSQGSPAPAAVPQSPSGPQSPLTGSIPVAPRPGDPPVPGQTRWAGMVASGQPVQGPGLVLPPLTGSQPMVPPPLTGSQPMVPPAGAVIPPPAPSQPLPPVQPPTDRDTRALPLGAQPTGVPGGSMHDTSQLPPVPAGGAAPVAGTAPVPPMDSFWGDDPRRAAGSPGQARFAPPSSQQPTPAPDGPAALRTGPAGWAARLPDGTVLDLDGGPVLIGRNPAPLVGLRAVAVADPGMSVSKTHLVLGADVAGAWVMDRGSTNGTLVTLPDGQRIVCMPDQRVRVAPGSVVFFGDLSLTIGLVDGSGVLG